jgi:competence protein ComGF
MMNFNSLKNKGITFLDTLVSLMLIMIIILMISSFTTFLKSSSSGIDKLTYLTQIINTEINSVYSKDWSTLSNKTIDYKSEKIYVNYSNYIEKTEYNTSKITIEFKLGDSSKTYNLERSVFKNE